MTDVARSAGVSIKTVSRVINRQPNVRADVKRSVEEAINALRYYPNALARGLVRQRSHLIGLIYENPSPSYVVELQRGVLDRLEGSGYRLVVMPVGSVAEHAAEIIDLLRAAALDGVVLGPPASDNPVVLRDLAASGIAYARIAPTLELDDRPAVTIDDDAAAEGVADYVLSLGHRDIAIITGDPGHASSRARMAGYRRALEQAGVTIADDAVACGYFTRDGGQDAARALLSGARRPSAILAQNDDMAIGAIGLARDLGLALPEDLSIVGFDDSALASIVWPRLTTVRQPVVAMAAAATDMVVAQLDRTPFDARADFWPELVIRDSAIAISAANRGTS